MWFRRAGESVDFGGLMTGQETGWLPLCKRIPRIPGADNSMLIGSFRIRIPKQGIFLPTERRGRAASHSLTLLRNQEKWKLAASWRTELQLLTRWTNIPEESGPTACTTLAPHSRSQQSGTLQGTMKSKCHAQRLTGSGKHWPRQPPHGSDHTNTSPEGDKGAKPTTGTLAQLKYWRRCLSISAADPHLMWIRQKERGRDGKKAILPHFHLIKSSSHQLNRSCGVLKYCKN